MSLSISTSLIDLHKHKIAGLSDKMSSKLAGAVANHAGKTDLMKTTIEDLFNYFPMRYEDRSNMLPIEELHDGLEASVDLFVRVSGGFRVGGGRNRRRRVQSLFIFEITGSDLRMTQKPVVVCVFISGKSANRIVNYWREKFKRGTRFVAYGKWEWDARRNTFALKLGKPDELEILPDFADSESFGLLNDQHPKGVKLDSRKTGCKDEKLPNDNDCAILNLPRFRQCMSDAKFQFIESWDSSKPKDCARFSMISFRVLTGRQ